MATSFLAPPVASDPSDSSKESEFDSPQPRRPKESMEVPDNASVNSTPSVSRIASQELDGTTDMPDLSKIETHKSETRSLSILKRKRTRLANKEAHPLQHLGITLGLPMILLFDIVIPCIIYYTWYIKHSSSWHRRCHPYDAKGEICPFEKPEFDKDILGLAIVCFGFGELWILIARIWRLVVHSEQCAPLLSRSKWELDATSWVYGVAVLLALIPFVIGSTRVIPVLYLYSPSFIMGFLGILMLITTVYPFTLPVGINSQPRGSKLRPFIYYAAEDFVAVDGLQDREFRVRYNERYEASKRFRRMFVWLTLWWMLGVCVYIGSVSAVIFTLEFHYAFGLSLGVLFSYISTWAAGTYAFVMWDMKRQDRLYAEGKDDV